MNTKQLIVIVIVVVLMGALLARPIKGLVTEDKGAKASATSTSSSAFNFQSVSDITKQSINASLAQEITALEEKAANADGDEKLALLDQLAKKWDDLAKYAPQGFIFEEMAKISPKFEYWLKAGDAYRSAYTNLQDTAMAAELNRLAIQSYEKATELDASSLDAKTGLGAAMVTGTNNPMAGIALLREVVAKDPKNIQANKTLGLFSLQSRQFDKAIERFKTVVELKPDAEAYFYLATGYENIGLKNEAIAAFQKSKELAADPTLSQFIDKRIDELSK
ncbi:tetratricopeptide repeat protein [Sphingobacterium suaedae]|uniref:Tetratricopeptide repeat protein n=1 Tax=Sphingobacterium suaedae TaxID=1686402 RepID=A0ABW5KE89_9SPHI